MAIHDCEAKLQGPLVPERGLVFMTTKLQAYNKILIRW